MIIKFHKSAFRIFRYCCVESISTRQNSSNRKGSEACDENSYKIEDKRKLRWEMPKTGTSEVGRQASLRKIWSDSSRSGMDMRKCWGCPWGRWREPSREARLRRHLARDATFLQTGPQASGMIYLAMLSEQTAFVSSRRN